MLSMFPISAVVSTPVILLLLLNGHSILWSKIVPLVIHATKSGLFPVLQTDGNIKKQLQHTELQTDLI